MSYENAPQTDLVATACACCGRPLCDAQSVETGMGPHCRKRHGYGETQGEPDWSAAQAAWDTAATLGTGGLPAGWGNDAHKACNVLVHRIACEQRGAGVVAMINAIDALGFVRLAERIAERVAQIHIEAVGAELTVRAPYDPAAVAIMARVPGRFWDRAEKVNRYPARSRVQLFAALCSAYPGAVASGPKGLFVVRRAA